MKITIVKILTLLLVIPGLAACKLRLDIGEGGYVTTESGAYECRQETAQANQASHAQRSLAGSGGVSARHAGEEDAGFHCDIDVADTDFDEVFIAVPAEGYRFTHWRKRSRGLFGNNTSTNVRLTTTAFPGTPLIDLLGQAEEIFYLEPVFEPLSVGTTDCSQFSSSFERIQTLVFDNYGCTNSACHGGGAQSGNLDLRPAVAYDNLFRVPASANLAEPLERVFPGEQKFSFLYAKLDAATNGTPLPAGGGSPMPIGGQPLSADHLEAMRLWIRNGAPRDTNVDGVASLLGCSSATTATANKIAAPDAPPLGEGAQFRSGPWSLAPNSEAEVCFATYYDLEKVPGMLPEWAKTPCEGDVFDNYSGSCFASNARTLTQDPQSHHSIVDVYTGSTSALDPSWGQWQCLNGPNQGASCDPTRIGEPVSAGGADCGGSEYVCGTQAVPSIACAGWGADDHAYKSVSMGGAQSPVAAQTYADGVYAVLPSRGVIIWNSHAFNLSSGKGTTIDQYNNFKYAPADKRNYPVRGIFDAKDIFVASVPPYENRTYCSTYTLPEGTRLGQLSSHAHKRGILWQTWLPPQDPLCKVSSGCTPNTSPADYVSRIYNDPLYLDYDPPLAFDSPNKNERTLKFCVTVDNGKNYPDLLKRNSTSVGTTCYGQAYCAGGSNPGALCGNDDGMCGGGECDACRVSGGFTTEDEMFLMLGTYFVVPPEERN